MAINIGPTLKRKREWARLTQQELIDHTGMDRSASYISALETGKSSPTLVELDQLARYFRTDVLGLLQEAKDETERRQGAPPPPAEGDEQIQRLFQALTEGDQALALDFLELLVRHKGRR